MPRSMTGYGTGRVSNEGFDVTVEIRSVNNRFLDFNFRLPHTLYSHEPDLRELIKKHLQRGRISIFVKRDLSEDNESTIRIDRGKARVLARQLEQLRQELNIDGELRLEHLFAIDDLILTEEDETYAEHLWEATKDALKIALDQLIENSIREADVLCKDIKNRIKKIHAQLSMIKAAAVGQVKEYQRRLSERLEELLTDNRLDRNRIEIEVALAADRLDISEEIVRLESHLQMFADVIKKKGAVGKNLGFILQEMGREANTIASKSWAIEISASAIRIKELLEQVREQAQNIE